MSSPRFLILVGYTLAKTLEAIKFANRMTSKLGVIEKVLVLNAPDLARSKDLKKAADDWKVIPGSNLLNEISGWQEGLDFLRQNHGDALSVIFVNDTVVSHRTFTRFRLSAFIRTALDASGNSVVGFIDGREFDGFSVAGLPLTGWVSTYCFFVTHNALARLDFRILDLPVASACINGGADEERFFSNSMSLPLRTHLRSWLFHGRWYASEPLTAENEERFVKKAQCIASEKWLSARCSNAMIRLLDPFDAYPTLKKLDKKTRKIRAVLSSLAQKL